MSAIVNLQKISIIHEDLIIMPNNLIQMVRNTNLIYLINDINKMAMNR